eukprot:1156978-Pelagomonas_calceolata.AAC.15
MLTTAGLDRAALKHSSPQSRNQTTSCLEVQLAGWLPLRVVSNIALQLTDQAGKGGPLVLVVSHAGIGDPAVCRGCVLGPLQALLLVAHDVDDHCLAQPSVGAAAGVHLPPATSVSAREGQ